MADNQSKIRKRRDVNNDLSQCTAFDEISSFVLLSYINNMLNEIKDIKLVKKMLCHCILSISFVNVAVVSVWYVKIFSVKLFLCGT